MIRIEINWGFVHRREGLGSFGFLTLGKVFPASYWMLTGWWHVEISCFKLLSLLAIIACFFKGWSSDGSDGCWRLWRPLELTLLIQFGRNHPSGNWYRCATIISWPGVSSKNWRFTSKNPRWWFFWPPIPSLRGWGFACHEFPGGGCCCSGWRSLKSGSRLRNGWEFLAAKQGVIFCIYIHINIYIYIQMFDGKFVSEGPDPDSFHLGKIQVLESSCRMLPSRCLIWCVKKSGDWKKSIVWKISALIIDFVGC